MTVINTIEIDNINYKRNEIKNAILNNDPIEDKLNVIIVISNPCLYAKRYILTREFIKRFEEEETNVNLYIVELCYGNQEFIITNSKNKKHLQLRLNTNEVIWHKENMINLGVKKLLPKKWKAFAWIDADIEFENSTWALDTLKILNGCKDVVQLWSHCTDMDADELTMRVFNSLGYQYSKGNPYIKDGPNYWHPGYAWACTRKAYERMGGLYEKAILGSGDNIMGLSLIGHGLKAVNSESTDDYKDSISEYQERVKHLRLGYVPGVIRHYYHGSKKNRKYTERWQILLRHNFSPIIHLENNLEGILIPTKACPNELLEEIMNYFKERNEDEDLLEKIKLEKIN
jgi:hypothetical protein